MHAGEQYSSHPDLAAEPVAAPPPTQLGGGVGKEDPIAPPAKRRWWIAAAWFGGGLVLFAFLVRISLSFPENSDGANSALQAWDMLHGNVLLHGWIVGDATYYTFELPLYSITEIFFGLQSLTVHLVSALTYVILAASAVAIARTNSRGVTAAARCAVVIAVLAAPLLTPSGVSILLEKPDHTGTAAILLVSFLLIDRAPARRFTPPLLCAILCAGQLGDATVLYIAVPAVLVVCAYRILATQNLRTGDAAILVAAVASVPLAALAHAAIKYFGGYLMINPQTLVAPSRLWGHHAALALRAIRALFGAVVSPVSPLGTAGALFGLACLLAAAFGFVKVVWTWRSASRSEQLLCVAIVVNIAVYVISTIPVPSNARELAAVLPCGAVLAARACVPSTIVGVRRSRVVIVVAALIALLPLGAAATKPPATPAAVPLAAWLEAHRLTYGIAGYWDASAVTLQSGNRVKVRAVALTHHAGPVRFAAKDWETKAFWYEAKKHDATFVIADLPNSWPNDNITVAVFEKYLHRRGCAPPVATYRVAGRVILIYRTNLLRYVSPALPLWTANS
jgi:hypothetical protein